MMGILINYTYFEKKQYGWSTDQVLLDLWFSTINTTHMQ